MEKGGGIVIESQKIEPDPSAQCVDCEWEGSLSECDVDYEWDPFYRNDVPYPICPKCAGGCEIC
jgi:hypothetical protein